MSSIYIASTEAFAGKTSLAIGLGKRLQQDGFRVGYIKPVTSTHSSTMGTSVCVVQAAPPPPTLDVVVLKAEFVRRELGLSEQPHEIAPIRLDPELLERAIRAPAQVDYRAQLWEAYQRVASDKDVVLVEGGDHPLEGSLIDASSLQVIEMFDARVLGIVRYDTCRCIDTAAGLRTLYGDRLLGRGDQCRAAPADALCARGGAAAAGSAGRPGPGRAARGAAALFGQRARVGRTVGRRDALLPGRIGRPGRVPDGRRHDRRAARSPISGSGPTRPSSPAATARTCMFAALETSTQCLILTGNQRADARGAGAGARGAGADHRRRAGHADRGAQRRALLWAHLCAPAAQDRAF